MIPFKVYSDYSIQAGFVKIDEYVRKAGELGLKAIALTDLNSISGIPEFFAEIQKYNKKAKNALKGIAGSNLRVSYGDAVGNLLVLCRNKTGWYELIKILARAELDKDGHLVSKVETVLELGQNLIIILGGLDSIVAIDPDVLMLVEGRENTFYSIEEHGITAEEDLNYLLEMRSEDRPMLVGKPIIYLTEPDHIYAHIICCSKHQITVKDPPPAGDPISALLFQGKTNCLPLANVEDVSDILFDHIEQFDVSGAPRIPSCIQDGKRVEKPDEVLLNLCRKGWVERGLNAKIAKDPNKDLLKIYTERVKEELSLFSEFKLANYLLLIDGFAKFARENKVSCTLRGSAGGCLVSYLIGLSRVDAVLPDPTLPYDPAKCLLFSRFMNRGRMMEGHVSLPDCDLDVGISFRAPLIQHIKDTYGESHVASIMTFSRMDARQTIKEIFRVLDPVPFAYEIANEITNHMVDKAKVQDELEDLKQADPTYNIIKYCLDHIPKIKEFYVDYKEQFDLAIRLVDTIRNTSKHAAGIVLADQPLENLFPVVKDSKTGENIISLEMEWAEHVGCVKFDLLGVAALEKIDKIREMIQLKLKQPRIGY